MPKKALSDKDIQFFLDKLQKIIESCNGFPEMTLRVRVEQWLHTFIELKLDINLTDYGLHDYEEIGPIKLQGAPDAIYGRLIFDYKAVGQLVNAKMRNVIINDIREKYLDSIPENMRSFFKCIIFDGKKIIFIVWDQHKREWVPSVENFTKKSLRKWLQWLMEFIGKTHLPNSCAKLSL